MQNVAVEPTKLAPLGAALESCGTRAPLFRSRGCFRLASPRSTRQGHPSRHCVFPRTSGYTAHRYYDPATAQFLSVDPLVNQTLQPFEYANDDPVNESDPLGLWGWNPISDVTEATNDARHFISVHRKGIMQIGLAVALAGVVIASGGILIGAGAIALVPALLDAEATIEIAGLTVGTVDALSAGLTIGGGLIAGGGAGLMTLAGLSGNESSSAGTYSGVTYPYACA